jgi:SAM-dependent MidA family methyltransferase
LATSAQLVGHIQAEIARAGFMSFARFMELALYAPGMGYYAAGSTKFGTGGD